MRNIALGLGVLTLVGVASSCATEERQATTTYYDRSIAPILTQSCASSPTGSLCHVTADSRGNALGNLSVETYDKLSLRQDLLFDYGPYGMPNLLLKAVPAFTLRLSSWDGEVQLVTTDIPHAGGSLFDRSSPSFSQVLRWLERGATANNVQPAQDTYEFTPCITTLGADPLFDRSVDPPGADFANFKSNVNPILTKSCAAGNCHGVVTSSLHLTCGETDEQIRWNYFAASDYVSADPPASELLRRSLDPARGGTFHEGGFFFSSTSDAGYTAVHNWIAEKGGPDNIPTGSGFDFFAKRVQPMLAKKGCMIVGCHSPFSFNSYRLRGGAAGYFSLPATRENYSLSLAQASLEGAPNASRLMRKNLLPSGEGILHRGGSLFASGGDPAACDLDAARTGDLDVQNPYCVMVAWLDIERQERMGSAAPLSSIVYVKRALPAGLDALQDYANYNGGSDLMRMGASIDVDTRAVSTTGTEESLLAPCGLDSASADVRRPSVSWDGSRIAFAARSTESEPLRVYVIDGDTCAVEPTIDAPPVDDAGNAVPTNGEMIHNFDPAFAPDGRIAFASTRGNVMNTSAFDYSGPQRSTADPSKLNSNIYVMENGSIRQLTFLLNQEVGTGFMVDGRVSMITEKRAPGFYQLAGRRINLDGGDYHPLFGQRSTIGYNQVTAIIQLSDKNFAAIFSDKGAAHGAGTLAIINRSIGIDQASQNEADYTVDKSAISYPNPDFYQHSIDLVDRNATGKLTGTQGAYRDPSPLPGGDLIVSYAADVTDLSQFSGNFDIVQVDPATHATTPLIQDAENLLWPVAVYARQDRGVFRSRTDEPNGHSQVYTDDARKGVSDLTVMDVPLITSLLFQNTRSGRVFDPVSRPVQVWESLPPEAGVTSYDQGGGFVTSDDFGQLYVRRRLLGTMTPNPDGSARFRIRGGMPMILAPQVQLDGDSEPVTHHQREEMQFYPGEFARQSFKRDLFNGLCGGCHGAVNGLESHVAANPDIITKASAATAVGSESIDLTGRPTAVPLGPPFP